jgi:DNA-binding response OmpR family regulator
MEPRFSSPPSSEALLESTVARVELWARLAGDVEVLRVGSSLVHRASGFVRTPKGEHRLRAKELELLTHLYDHTSATFTRDELLRSVWNCDAALLTRTVDQTVATLRKKIEADPQQPRFLQTVYGIGYKLVL